jgi:hypothetical protein
LTYQGLTFNGWNTGQYGGGIPYAADDSLPVADNVVLYAQWVISPPMVNAAAVNDGSIQLSWDSVGGADYYYIYRANSLEGAYSSLTTLSDSTSYTDSTVSPGSTWYYEVITFNIVTGYNEHSDVVWATAYGVGISGPAGGIVFYDKGAVSDGWRYLEAAPVDREFTADWGSYGTAIGGTDTAVGRGKQNTDLIITWLGANGGAGKAAQLCDSLEVGGYDDWFLPSKDELDWIYKNLKQTGLGSFTDSYWSSSEFDSTFSWLQWFSGSAVASQVNGSKDRAHYVRAVRAF